MDVRNRSLTGWAGFGGPRGFAPKTLVLHDYGGRPKNSDGMFNPYNALVFPDGSVRYRDPSNPYGTTAPHAYKLNPTSVGLSYAGPVGSTPTPQAMDTLRAERDKIVAQHPGLETLSHGEAYQKTAGGPQQASRDGRGLDEASWRTRLNWSPYDIDNDPNPPELGGAAPIKTPDPSTHPETRVAGYQAAMPSTTQAEQPGFLGLLSDSMMSPLFQMGAGVFGAASDGKNIGAGLMQGGQAAQRAQAMQLQSAEAKRKLAAQAQMRGLWGNLATLGLPPEQTAALTALGPEAGAPLLTQLIQAKAERELLNADPLRKAQVAKAQADIDMLPTERRLREAQTKKAEADAEAKETPDQIFRVREQQALRMGLPRGTMQAPGPFEQYVLTGKMPREDQQPLTATDKKAILEADEMVLAAQNSITGLNKALELSKKAYSGPMAATRGSVASSVTPWATPQADATVELGQVTTQQALESLKATFGAAPTEGERKILLDMQGSANQSQAVREAIYKRAAEAAQRRLKFNQDRANELRGGTYYGAAGAKRQPGAAQPSQAAPAQPAGEQKHIGGKTYVKIDGQWYEQ